MNETEPIRVERVLRATREDVFAAWTDPARLRAWFGPPGAPVMRLDGDLRPGGAYRLVLADPGGGERELEWTFREIDAPRRLVYGWRWLSGSADMSTVVVEFTDLGDRTLVSVEHSGLPPGIRDVHESGWIGCLDSLAGQY
jgi:uncharacterized protein YndB with AHSA1/START domain